MGKEKVERHVIAVFKIMSGMEKISSKWLFVFLPEQEQGTSVGITR